MTVGGERAGPGRAGTLHIAGVITAQSTGTTLQGDGAVRGQGIKIFAGNVLIDATGGIDADAQGYQPSTSGSVGDGPSPAPNSSTTGASYGGAAGGGQGSANSVYGSATAPVDLGSGGSQYAGDGGFGGGAIQLFVAGTLTNNGSISANAGPATGYTAAGAGGSVYVGAHTIAGSGMYSANGGVNPGIPQRDGGGGRIAIDYIVNQGVQQSSLTVTGTGSATNGTISFLQTVHQRLPPAHPVRHPRHRRDHPVVHR